MKIPIYIFTVTLALTISLRFILAETSEEKHSTRLIIGFHSNLLSSEEQPIEYLNKHLKSDSVIRLLRPINNKTVLAIIETINPNTLSEDIKNLLRIEEVRFIEMDQTMKPISKNGTGPVRLR